MMWRPFDVLLVDTAITLESPCGSSE